MQGFVRMCTRQLLGKFGHVVPVITVGWFGWTANGGEGKQIEPGLGNLQWTMWTIKTN